MQDMFSTFPVCAFVIFCGQIVVKATCPDGFQNNRGQCYKVFYIPSTWIEAKMYCLVFGTDLAAIESAEEMSVMKGILTTAPDNSSFFIDGSDAMAENDWRWMKKDGKAILMTYSNWAPGEPDNREGREHCMELHHMLNDNLWHDRPCEERKGFICEVA